MLKDGLPPAAALRQAQIALWQDAEWSAPYFWAAFVIQGEWR
jgi:CHAT domain-containing protein